MTSTIMVPLFTSTTELRSPAKQTVSGLAWPALPGTVRLPRENQRALQPSDLLHYFLKHSPSLMALFLPNEPRGSSRGHAVDTREGGSRVQTRQLHKPVPLGSKTLCFKVTRLSSFQSTATQKTGEWTTPCPHGWVVMFLLPLLCSRCLSFL